MSVTVEEMTKAALALDEHDRAALANTLLASLDDGSSDLNEVDAAWRAEARTRVADLRAGRVKSVPWAEVKAHLAADRAARTR